MEAENEKFVRCLCPSNAQEAKLVNKFIKIVFESREKIDNGIPIFDVNYFQEQII